MLIIFYALFNQNIHYNMLNTACLSGRETAVKLLLAVGTHVDSNNQPTTPLIIASAAGHESIVELLLAHHANIDAKTDTGITPLSAAVLGHHKGIEDMLRHAGAK
jgi:ankyrin repeat protein